jgi:hypothetical protein
MIRIVTIALVAAIIVIALALAARAQTPILPPLEYDQPFTGKITIIEADNQKEVQRLCNISSPRIACSRRNLTREWCFIIKISNAALRGLGWNPDHIMRHEHAHCWTPGWSQAHEGARLQTPEEDARWNALYDRRDLWRTSTPVNVQFIETRSGQASGGAWSLGAGR